MENRCFNCNGRARTKVYDNGELKWVCVRCAGDLWLTYCDINVTERSILQFVVEECLECAYIVGCSDSIRERLRRLI